MRQKHISIKRRKMRGKSVVWDHFNCDEDEGQASSPTGGKSRPAAYCRYCNLKYTFPNATKMMRHLLKCTLCPDDTKRELEQSGFGEYRADHHVASLNGSLEEDLAPPSMVRPRMSPVFQETDSPTPGTSALSPRSHHLAVPNPMARNNPRESPSEHGSRDLSRYDDADQISPTDRLLAKAIFCTDAPLSIVENCHWQDLFRHMQPTYVLPSRHALTGTLLDDEYVGTLERVSLEINKAQFAAVLAHYRPCYSRAESATNGQVNLVITTPKPQFLGCLDTGQHQSPTVLADSLAGVITKVEPTRVLIVVTGLEQNMRDSWPVISSRFPYTTVAGYPVEGLDKILRSVLAVDCIQEMATRASKVCDYRNYLVTIEEGPSINPVKLSCSSSEFKSAHGKSMIALEALMECKDKLHDSVVAHAQTVESETKEIILNNMFWDTLAFVVQFWRNFHLSKANLEREAIRLSDVAVEILNFSKVLHGSLRTSPLSSSEKDMILKQFDEIRTACCKDIHFAACLVDPRYCGSCLSDEDTNSAMQYIVELAKQTGQDVGRVLANLAEYRAKDGGLWSQECVWDAATHVAPATWWKGICDRQPLSHIANGILSLAMTSSMSSLEAGTRGESLNRDQAQRLLFVRANSEPNPQPPMRPDMIRIPGGY